MADAALTFRDLTLGYGSHAAVHHLSGTVRRGSLTAIVGANGSGKSTLLKGIVGVLKPMAGSSTAAPDARIAYLPQQSELDRTFPASVLDLVTMGLWPSRGLLGRIGRDERARVTEAIASVGLSGFEARPLDSLSGGQMQRALFARLIVQDASILLLDEPFNAIDEATVQHLLAIISGWHRAGLTVIVVMHDLDLVRTHFPETLLLARGPVAWGPTTAVLQADALSSARRFDEAWHSDAPWCEPAGQDGPDHRGHEHHGHAHGHVDSGSIQPAPRLTAKAS